MKQSILLTILAILFILLSPAIASADIIYLNDGTEIRGNIIEITNETITIKNDDSESIIDIASITKIVFEAKEGQDTEYSQLRDRIKTELENLAIENANIIIEIKRIEEETINVSYDEYDIYNKSHCVDGINLKDYYNLDKKPKYEDKIYYYKPNDETFDNVIIGEIIDLDKEKIKIKTLSGVATKNIEIVYQITLNNSGKNILEKGGRKALTFMIEYYNANYWKFEKYGTSLFEITSYLNKGLYKKYGPKEFFSFSINASANLFNLSDFSPAASLELLYTMLYNHQGTRPLISLGAYIGIYFNAPHEDPEWGYSHHYHSSAIVLFFEANIGGSFGNGVFELFVDLAGGLTISLTGSSGFIAGGIGLGFNWMFTKVFGLRFLANFKAGVGGQGFGFDVGLIFRFGN